jgi:kinesin family protein C1
MAQHDPEPEAEPQGGHPFSFSRNPKENLSMLYVQKNASRGSANRMYSLYVPRERPQPPEQRSISSPSSLRPCSAPPAEPADTDCDDILHGFGALKLGASSGEGHGSRMGRGTIAGKNLDIFFPSHIPRHTPSRAMPPPPVPMMKSPRRPRTPVTPYLNKYTNDRAPAFDDTRVASLEAQFAAWKEQMEADMDKQSKVQESIELYKTKSECKTYDISCQLTSEAGPVLAPFAG